MKKPKIPAAPGHFSDRSKALWKAVHREFQLEADATAILQVALEHADLGDLARQELRRAGLVEVGPRGARRLNPLVSAASVHDSTFARLLKQLGLDIVAPGEPAGRRMERD